MQEIETRESSALRTLKCVDDREYCTMYSEVELRYIDRVKILVAQSRTLTDPIKADLADKQRAVRTSVPHHPTLLSTGCALELLLRLLLCTERRMEARTLLLSLCGSLRLSPKRLLSSFLRLRSSLLRQCLLPLLSCPRRLPRLHPGLFRLPTSPNLIHHSLAPCCLSCLLLFLVSLPSLIRIHV